MEWILFRICFFSSCFAWVWVDMLTVNRGLLDFIPNYYPLKLKDKPLMCSFCLAGWIAYFSAMYKFITMFYGGWISSFDCAFYILLAPMVSMYLIALIKR